MISTAGLESRFQQACSTQLFLLYLRLRMMNQVRDFTALTRVTKLNCVLKFWFQTCGAGQGIQHAALELVFEEQLTCPSCFGYRWDLKQEVSQMYGSQTRWAICWMSCMPGQMYDVKNIDELVLGAYLDSGFHRCQLSFIITKLREL